MSDLRQGWKKVSISDVAKVVTGKTPPTKKSGCYGGSIPFVTPGDLGKVKYVENSEKKLTLEGAKHSPVIPAGSTLFTCIGIIGKVGFAGKRLRTNQQINSAIPKDIEPEYLYYALASSNKRIARSAGIHVVPIINKTEFENQVIFIPENRSAQKIIANTLQTWDTAIEKTEALIAAKERQFGWLVKNLISTTKSLGGQKRITLKEIGDISSAGVDKKIVGGEKDVVLLNYLDVYRRDQIYANELTHKVTAPKPKVDKCSIKKGDIFFTPTSEVREDIGRSSVAMEDVSAGVYSYHIIRLRPQIELDLLYSTFAFKGHSFYKQASRYADGSGQRYVVSLDNFRKIEISLPPMEEQKRIGKILDTARRETNLLKKLVEQYRTQKRGLMQKLLSGRWRTKKV